MSTTIRSPSSRSKGFRQRIADAEGKGNYIKVGRDKVGNLKVTKVTFSEKSLQRVWGSGSQSDHQFIYIPALRLAGRPEDIQAYLNLPEQVAAGFSQSELQQAINGAITFHNYIQGEDWNPVVVQEILAARSTPAL